MNEARARPRIALALSGGGFRASVFHLGALRRIAEAGWLDRVDVISTVSGGSVIGAFAVLRWRQVMESGGDWPALERYVVRPFLELITEGNYIKAWALRVPLHFFRKQSDKVHPGTKLAAELWSERFFDGRQ